jgi:polyphosphate kinase
MNKKTISAKTPTSIYLNRELSQLAFNRRVLAQAEDKDVPLLERLRFLCIVGSNLDEFFEVRLASLLAQNRMGGDATVPPSLAEALDRASEECHAIV